MGMRNLLLASLTFSLLAGCSLFPGREPVDYKSGATPTPALEVPPDLTMPATGQRYAIPEQDGTQVASYSAYNRAPAEQPCAAPADSAAPVPAATQPPRLMTVDGRTFVLLDDAFDRAWRKVHLALERAKLATSDVDRNKGIFYLKPIGKPPVEVRVQVHETAGASVVTAQAEQADQAAHVLETLYHQMGN